MIDETDISQERQWFYDQRAKTVVNNLQKRNINAQYVASRKEALPAILEMIPEEATVVRGDSITIDQIGIIPELKKRNQNAIIDPFQWDADGYYLFEKEERHQMYREAFFADIFLTGVNAITLDGKLVSTDALGNRVAAMVFGPKRVIVAVGVNKIVKDADEARERIRNVAAPVNAQRHYLKHRRSEFGDLPCVRTGSCIDCRHDQRICSFTVIVEGPTLGDKERLNVVLVGEELGI